MARPCKPLQESLRWEIYLQYRRWCEQHGTVCTPNSFRIRILPNLGYPMANGTFQREWQRLIKEDKLIRLEPTTLAPIIVDLAFVDARIADEVRKRLAVQISA